MKINIQKINGIIFLTFLWDRMISNSLLIFKTKQYFAIKKLKTDQNKNKLTKIKYDVLIFKITSFFFKLYYLV